MVHCRANSLPDCLKTTNKPQTDFGFGTVGKLRPLSLSPLISKLEISMSCFPRKKEDGRGIGKNYSMVFTVVVQTASDF